MGYALLVLGSVACALWAVRSQRLIASALWLGGTSAFTAILLYQIGAHEVAVIELSVGAGLVTILFVYAINLAGDDRRKPPALVLQPLAWGLALVTVVLLSTLILSSSGATPPSASDSFSTVLWEERSLDVLLQIALIFAGVLSVLGLLAESLRPNGVLRDESLAQKKAAVQLARAPGNGHGPASEESIAQEELSA